MPVLLVDDEDKLKTLLSDIISRTKDKQLLFIDLEGVNLGRTGSLAIMQIMLPPNPLVYLVDIHTLSSTAFTTAGDQGIALQSILEAADIPKVFFDVRNDSDALYHHSQINLRCVVDLQLIEYAVRQPRGKHVCGLGKCIDINSGSLSLFTSETNRKKQEGKKLFAPEKGGKCEVFLERPLPQALIDYCEQDVLLMPGLLKLFASRLLPGVAAQLQTLVDQRVAVAQDPNFNGKGQHMAIGPTLAPARGYRGVELTFPMSAICSPDLKEMCRLDKKPDHLASVPPPSNPDTIQQGLVPATTDDNQSSGLEEAGWQQSRPGQASGSSMGVVLGHRGFEPEDEQEQDEGRYEGYSRDSNGYQSEESNKDFTACDLECGYCGHCGY